MTLLDPARLLIFGVGQKSVGNKHFLVKICSFLAKNSTLYAYSVLHVYSKLENVKPICLFNPIRLLDT